MLLLYFCFLILCLFNCGISTDPSVIIVGAGPAGIAAATKLLENSITNIKILEAENRIGGRINSVKFGDAIVDIGAEFVHGEKGNIVFELVKDFNILKPGSPILRDSVYYSNGSQLDSSLIQEVQSLILEFEGDDYNKTELSLGDVFINKYNSTLLKKYENDKEKLKILREGIRFSEGFILGNEGAFSWFDSSALSDYEESEGSQVITWNGLGYKTILEVLMKSYPDPKTKLPIDDKIYLNKKVTRVIWNASDSIAVQTADNNSYSADYVIFTPSLGVLKKQKTTLFNPQLPSAKQNAIEAIGFDGLIKVFLYFPTRWWKSEDKMFLFFWSDEDLNTIHFPGPTKNGVSWIVQLRSLVQAPNNPNVLIGWIDGDMVPDVEQLSLENLRGGITYVINKFLGKSYNVSEIGQIIRSGWYSNKHFHGTYSYTKTGFYKQNVSYQTDLAEPLNGVAGKPSLLFAGEATSAVHYSTVHGAIETGHREAERIIKLYNDKEK